MVVRGVDVLLLLVLVIRRLVRRIRAVRWLVGVGWMLGVAPPPPPPPTLPGTDSGGAERERANWGAYT